MQKAYSLSIEEQTEVSQLENEQRNLLAQLGAISIDKKRIKKALPANEEKQRALLRKIVERHGVTQYTAARLQSGNLVVEVPDEAVEVIPPGKANGAAHVEA